MSGQESTPGATEPGQEVAAGASGWAPVHDRQHPPFGPGNDVAVRHGAYSPRKVEPLAAELVDLVLADPAASHAQAAHHRPALWAWARAEAQVQVLTEWLAVEGEVTRDGVGDLDAERVRAAYLLLHRAEARATTQRSRLGLDPLSQARLGRDRAAAQVDMARVMAELERRDREQGHEGRRGPVEGEVER